MPAGPAYRPDPRFPALGPGFADPVRPAAFPEEIVRFRNDRAAAAVGLDTLDDAEWTTAFARFEPLAGNLPEPLALRYHGHQFRVYNPDLGDGRGFLFAQLREAETGRLLDLGTKGSGRTPWSRQGDGRLTLKGAVREALASEMLEALGVPTSRTFSVVETGEALERSDEPSPTRSAVLTRLSWSHVRYGTFQRHAFEDRPDRVRALCDHVREVYFPALEDPSPAALLAEIGEGAARLVSTWTAAGFVHGVLNTDNMNVTGESFDYGPWRFLPRYEPGFTAAYFDHGGLYAFDRQADAVAWNLARLAECFALVAEEGPLVAALEGWTEAWRREIRSAFLRRLGVRSAGFEADGELVRSTLAFLKAAGPGLRWEPLFFDWFCGAASQTRAMDGPRAGLYAGAAFDAFHAALMAHDPNEPERLGDPWFSRPEPEEMLHDEVERIWAAIDGSDDWGPFAAKIAAVGRARAAWGLAER